jgi:hypothetical protein
MDTFILLAETSLPPWVDEIVVLAIKIFGAALVALAALAIRRLAKKWGVEETAGLEMLARSNTQRAIDFADRWAKQQDEKPGGKGKLEKALDRLIEIEENLGVTDIVRQGLARRIEERLEAEVKEGNGDGQT